MKDQNFKEYEDNETYPLLNTYEPHTLEEWRNHSAELSDRIIFEYGSFLYRMSETVPFEDTAKAFLCLVDENEDPKNPKALYEFNRYEGQFDGNWIDQIFKNLGFKHKPYGEA